MIYRESELADGWSDQYEKDKERDLKRKAAADKLARD